MDDRTKPAIGSDIAPNVIPLIDVMLLLLLFFLLGSDMTPRDQEDVRLPRARTIREDCRTYMTPPPLTVNVYHRSAGEVICDAWPGRAVCREPGHWLTGVRGSDYRSPARLRARLQAEAARLPDLRQEGPRGRRLRVRADAAAPAGLVQQAMAACASAGIYRVDCNTARMPAQEWE